MKLSRVTATVFGVAIVASTAIASVGPASASTPGATFITTADIATPGSFGTTGWSNPGPGTLTDTALNGLSINVNARPFYGFGSNVPTVGGSTLRGIGDSSFFYTSNDIDLTAQISWYAGPGETNPHYFIAAGDGADYFTDPSLMWFTDVTIGTISGGLDQATLSEFDAQLATDPTFAGASVQGVGFYNQGAPSVNLYNFLAGGNIFYFTPEPVSVAPTTLGQVDFGTSGFTFSTTGFVPGETVQVYLNTTESTSDPIPLVADSNGAITYTWVAPVTNMVEGAYEVRAVGDTSAIVQLFDFDLVTQALAETGVDVAMPLAVASALLLGGAAMLVIMGRRRKRA